MFVLRANQFQAGDTQDGVIVFRGNSRLISTKENSPFSLPNQIEGENGNKIKILTIIQSNSPKLYIRLINCSFTISTFMVVIVEDNPSKDSLIEFIDTTNNGHNQPLLLNQVNGLTKEIRIRKKVDQDQNSLSSEVQFSVNPFNNWINTVSNPTNKFIKIFNHEENKKLNYILDFSFDSTASVGSFSNLRKTSEDDKKQTSLDMKFSQLVQALGSTTNNTIFSSEQSEKLEDIVNKNKKLYDLTLEIKQYLEQSKQNIDTYSRFKI